jgi:hypothetical protein
VRNSVLAGLLVVGMLSACAGPVGPLTVAPVATAQATTVKKSGLTLDPGKIKVVGFTNRYMEVTGEAGAIVAGDGLWMSFGRQEKPIEGWERVANPDGSFKQIILDLKVPETVTFWAWHDEGEKRIYGAPVVMPVSPAKSAGAARLPR